MFVKVTAFDVVTAGAAHSSPYVAEEFAVRTCPLVQIPSSTGVEAADAVINEPFAVKISSST